MDFIWDTSKARANISKHSVDFPTASRIFLDPYLIEFEDERGYGERRWNAIGMVDERILFVTYTEENEYYRIISARGAEPHEKRRYHNEI